MNTIDQAIARLVTMLRYPLSPAEAVAIINGLRLLADVAQDQVNSKEVENENQDHQTEHRMG